jgi:hypothetical protein
VTSGRRDLERPLGDLLPFDLRQIGPAVGRFGLGGLWRRYERSALEMG